MNRPRLSAAALRDELNQAALRLSRDSERARIDFMLPTPADPDEGIALPDGSGHNRDVQAYCPEALDGIARRAVEQVAALWDLDATAGEADDGLPG